MQAIIPKFTVFQVFFILSVHIQVDWLLFESNQIKSNNFIGVNSYTEMIPVDIYKIQIQIQK